jgi:hypothetical protein
MASLFGIGMTFVLAFSDLGTFYNDNYLAIVANPVIN